MGRVSFPARVGSESVRVSSKLNYAVAAMLELASRAPEYISVAELAARRHIPRTFLEQLLLRMKRRELTVSRRGPDGGYALGRSPGEISLADIYAAVEGPLKLCDHEKTCGDAPSSAVLNAVWRDLEREIRDFLAGITLEDLLHRAEEVGPKGIPLAHSYTFSI